MLYSHYSAIDLFLVKCIDHFLSVAVSGENGEGKSLDLPIAGIGRDKDLRYRGVFFDEFFQPVRLEREGQITKVESLRHLLGLCLLEDSLSFAFGDFTNDPNLIATALDG